MLIGMILLPKWIKQGGFVRCLYICAKTVLDYYRKQAVLSDFYICAKIVLDYYRKQVDLSDFYVYVLKQCQIIIKDENCQILHILNICLLSC